MKALASVTEVNCGSLFRHLLLALLALVVPLSSVACMEPKPLSSVKMDQSVCRVVCYKKFDIRTDEDSVVTMHVPVGGGSGFVINDDGFVVTNHHVVKTDLAGQSCSKYAVFFGVRDYSEAEVVAYDEDRDLAVLRPLNNLNRPPLTIYDPSEGEVAKASPVTLIGYPAIADYGNSTSDFVIYATALINQKEVPGVPENQSTVVLRGTIAGYRVNNSGLHIIMVSQQVSSGSSGSPLIDDHERVVGVNFMSVSQVEVKSAEEGARGRATLARDGQDGGSGQQVVVADNSYWAIDSLELVKFLDDHRIEFKSVKKSGGYFFIGLAVGGILLVASLIVLIVLLARRKSTPAQPGSASFYVMTGSYGTHPINSLPAYIGSADSVCDIVIPALPLKCLEVRRSAQGLEVRDPYSGARLSVDGRIITPGTWVRLPYGGCVEVSGVSGGSRSGQIWFKALK